MFSIPSLTCKNIGTSALSYKKPSFDCSGRQRQRQRGRSKLRSSSLRFAVFTTPWNDSMAARGQGCTEWPDGFWTENVTLQWNGDNLISSWVKGGTLQAVNMCHWQNWLFYDLHPVPSPGVGFCLVRITSRSGLWHCINVQALALATFGEGGALWEICTMWGHRMLHRK